MFFPDYQLDNGHVVKPNPTLGSAIFSMDYPPVPDTQKLRENPNLPVHDKEYSTDDNPPQTRVFAFLHPMMTIVTIANKAMCKNMEGAPCFVPHATPPIARYCKLGLRTFSQHNGTLYLIRHFSNLRFLCIFL